MTSEVREAAGRLRRVQLYGGRERQIQVYGGKWGAPFERDKNELVRAYLAANMPDDEMEIDWKWWESVASKYGTVSTEDEDIELTYATEYGVAIDVYTESCPLSHIKTRGQLRRLCECLNITLKPSGQETQS